MVGNGISEPSTVLLFQRIPPFKVPEMFGNMDIFMKKNTHLRELNPPPKKIQWKKSAVHFWLSGELVWAECHFWGTQVLQRCWAVILTKFDAGELSPPNGGDGKGNPPKCVA